MATETDTGDDPELTYPTEDVTGFFKNHFGPSMLWALIGIGGSHVLLAPIVASVFGLLAVPVYAFIFLVRYGGWELGVRYTYATGQNPIEGYKRLPGPKNWALWLTVVNFTLIASVILASVGVTSAGFVAAFVGRAGIGSISPVTAHVGLVALAAAVVGISRYSALEKTLTVFTVVIFALIGVGVLVGPPSADLIRGTLLNIPDRPTGLYVGLFAAAAGVTPAGFSNTVFIGSWTVAKQQGARELRERDLDPTDDTYHDYIRAWIRTGKRDFNLGYAFSFVLLLAMVVTSANVLYPTMPTDENFAVKIGSVLSESFGPWSFYVMVVGAFAAVYSTVIALLDGASRATVELLAALFHRELDQERARRGLVAALAIGGIAPVVAFGSLPVTFALIITLTIAVFEVFYYPANWYIVETELPEPLRPSTPWRAYYALSLVVVLVIAALAAVTQLGGS